MMKMIISVIIIHSYKKLIFDSSKFRCTNKKIGAGTNVWQFCVILENAIIGNNCNINAQCFIENDVIIGNNVTIKSGVQIWDGITLRDNVFIGPNVTFTNDFQPRSKQYPEKFLTTIIEENVSIGANSTILGGLCIGKSSMIGAGSLVSKNIPNNTLWYGNPASFKAFICDCGLKLDKNYFCLKCIKQFNLNTKNLLEST